MFTLKKSYNKLIAFLYGWSFFAVIQTGTIAAVGVAFSKFTAYFIPAVSEDNILFSTMIGTLALYHQCSAMCIYSSYCAAYLYQYQRCAKR